jgi:hypothetical protein
MKETLSQKQRKKKNSFSCHRSIQASLELNSQSTFQVPKVINVRSQLTDKEMTIFFAVPRALLVPGTLIVLYVSHHQVGICTVHTRPTGGCVTRLLPFPFLLFLVFLRFSLFPSPLGP